MIAADQAWPAGPRRPVCGDQLHRIDFERAGRVDGDVSAREMPRDRRLIAQQKPANLPVRRSPAGGEDRCPNVA